MSPIAQNFEKFRRQLAEVCARVGRDPAKITIVAATKNSAPPEINSWLRAGGRVIGENRVLPALAKFPEVSECERHFIGHLQTNKANEVARHFDCVESVDSLKLARKLATAAAALGKTLPIFLQANLTQEDQKTGFAESELVGALAEMKKLPAIKVVGLMVMGAVDDALRTRTAFQRGAELVRQLGLPKFSAGMSADWSLAVTAGATHLRIGSAFFAK